MNKLLIGALAGLADLSQLVSSIKTKSGTQFSHGYYNRGGGNTVNFFDKPVYQDQRLNQFFSPNQAQTQVAFNLPATSSITANPADNPQLPYYGNPYFCKDRHEALLANMDQRIKDMEDTSEANAKDIVTLKGGLEGVEPRIPTLDVRATSNTDMIAMLDQRVMGNESALAAADVESTKVTESISETTPKVVMNEQTIAMWKSRNGTNADALDAVDGKVTANEGAIQMVDPMIGDNTGEIQALGSMVDMNSAALPVLDDRVGTNTGLLEDINP